MSGRIGESPIGNGLIGLRLTTDASTLFAVAAGAADGILPTSGGGEGVARGTSVRRTETGCPIARDTSGTVAGVVTGICPGSVLWIGARVSAGPEGLATGGRLGSPASESPATTAMRADVVGPWSPSNDASARRIASDCGETRRSARAPVTSGERCVISVAARTLRAKPDIRGWAAPGVVEAGAIAASTGACWGGRRTDEQGSGAAAALEEARRMAGSMARGSGEAGATVVGAIPVAKDAGTADCRVGATLRSIGFGDVVAIAGAIARDAETTRPTESSSPVAVDEPGTDAGPRGFVRADTRLSCPAGGTAGAAIHGRVASSSRSPRYSRVRFALIEA